MGKTKRKIRRYHPHLDAAENIYFGNNIRQTRARTYDLKLPNLKGRTLVPVDTETDNAVDTITYQQFTAVGVAKIIASYADDLPRADILGKTFSAPVKSLGAAYGYNIQEIRKSQRAGIPLPQRKANAARRAIEEAIDRIIGTGDAANGLLGMLNQPNALLYTVPDGAGAASEWPTKTPAEILRDMHGIAQFGVDTTKGAEQPDTLLLPPSRYGLVATTYLSDTNNQTILQAFLATSPYIRNVDQWSPLETAGAGGVKRMVSYRRDPDAIQFPIPQDFEQFEEERRGLELVVPCHARVGGVLLYYPFSMAYGDGI